MASLIKFGCLIFVFIKTGMLFFEFLGVSEGCKCKLWDKKWIFAETKTYKNWCRKRDEQINKIEKEIRK